MRKSPLVKKTSTFCNFFSCPFQKDVRVIYQKKEKCWEISGMVGSWLRVRGLRRSPWSNNHYKVKIHLLWIPLCHNAPLTKPLFISRIWRWDSSRISRYDENLHISSHEGKKVRRTIYWSALSSPHQNYRPKEIAMFTGRKRTDITIFKNMEIVVSSTPFNESFVYVEVTWIMEGDCEFP